MLWCSRRATFRSKLIPNAVRWFTGEANEDDEDEEEDEDYDEDDDDEDDDEDDDDDEVSDASCESLRHPVCAHH